MILYLNIKENRIEAILKRPDPNNPFKPYCKELELPDDFNIQVEYLNAEGESRLREMTVEELETALSYRERRYNNYPKLAEQMDMLWHAMDKGELPKVESFYNAIKQVKEQFPKDN
jgi:hypothetical protein